MDTKTRVLKAINFFEQLGDDVWKKDLFRKRWFPTFISLVKEYINGENGKTEESGESDYEKAVEVFGVDENKPNV